MKNNFLRTVFFIFLVGQLGHLGHPWWTLIPVAMLAGWLFSQGAVRCFWAGFAGGFLLWISAAYLLDQPNGGLLAGKIGALFGGLSRWHVLLLTGVLGGLPAGLGCLTGHSARALFPAVEK